MLKYLDELFTLCCHWNTKECQTLITSWQHYTGPPSTLVKKYGGQIPPRKLGPEVLGVNIIFGFNANVSSSSEPEGLISWVPSVNLTPSSLDRGEGLFVFLEVCPPELLTSSDTEEDRVPFLHLSNLQVPNVPFLHLSNLQVPNLVMSDSDSKHQTSRVDYFQSAELIFRSLVRLPSPHTLRDV
uniref:Uncharacterized protein n=1 Tax=Timema monikensis TaxID=170555 RepID=A0A7R9E335_9NEOP|nr:unnamed protein product [Timema monikensis]